MNKIKLKDVIIGISVSYIIFGILLILFKDSNPNLYIKLINSIDSILLVSGILFILSIFIDLYFKRVEKIQGLRNESKGGFKIKEVKENGAVVCKFKFKDRKYDYVILESEQNLSLIENKENKLLTFKEFKDLVS